MKTNYAERREPWLDMPDDDELLPGCRCCGYPIHDDTYWDINGDIYCDACARDLFCKNTEDYAEEFRID